MLLDLSYLVVVVAVVTGYCKVVVELLNYLCGATIGGLCFLPFYSPVEVASWWNSGICLTLAELGEGVVDADELATTDDDTC